jgi:hypothetical protein
LRDLSDAIAGSLGCCRSGHMILIYSEMFLGVGPS